MKITDVTSFPVFNGQRNNLFVTVDTDEGIFGVGESGLSGRELAVMGAVEHLKPMLVSPTDSASLSRFLPDDERLPEECATLPGCLRNT